MNFEDFIRELDHGFYVINKIYLYPDKSSDKYIKFNKFNDFVDYIRQNNYDKESFCTFYNVFEVSMYIGILWQ